MSNTDDSGDGEDGLLPVSEFNALKRALVQLDDADLNAWDREFVDDMFKRFDKFGRAMTMTGAQEKQFERIKDQHL